VRSSPQLAIDRPRQANRTKGWRVAQGVDDHQRQALRAEGLDPDDPAVIAAIDFVRWELSHEALPELRSAQKIPKRRCVPSDRCRRFSRLCALTRIRKYLRPKT
jgi:hypothetical protein